MKMKHLAWLEKWAFIVFFGLKLAKTKIWNSQRSTFLYFDVKCVKRERCQVKKQGF